jgi:hypothetical protein
MLLQPSDIRIFSSAIQLEIAVTIYGVRERERAGDKEREPSCTPIPNNG